MDSPTAIFKQALNPGSIIKLAIATLVVFALLDLAGWTTWILYPITSAKAKWGTKTAS